MRNTSTAPLIRTLTLDGGEWSALHPGRFNPKNESRYPPNLRRAGPHSWCAKKNYLPPTCIRTPYRPGRGLVTILSYPGSCRDYTHRN